MSKYTAEDFKNANIAVRGTLHAARRAEPDTTLPWVYGDSGWDDDKGMVENGWRPVRESAPLTLDTLREAWETAESLDACRSILSEGDVLIIKEPHDIYLVRPACEGVFVGRADAENARVLHRAPQPEAHADLADVIRSVTHHPEPNELAKALHAAGVTVTNNGQE